MYCKKQNAIQLTYNLFLTALINDTPKALCHSWHKASRSKVVDRTHLFIFFQS